MIMALATGNGLRKEIRAKLTGFSGHVQILNYEPGYAYEQDPVSLNAKLHAQIKSLPEVEHMQKFGRKAGIIKHQGLFEGVVLKGVNRHYQWSYFEPYLLKGELPQITDTAYSNAILISKVLADKLRLSLSDTCAMYFVRQNRPPLLRRFSVSGIFRTDFEEIDQNFIVGDLKHVQRLNKWDSAQVGGYEIFVKNEAQAALLAQQLRSQLPLELDALTAKELNPQIYQWIKLFDINIQIILIIMVVVATINMSIALLTIILERTPMIGLFKALGSTNRQVRRIFLSHAALLIIRGMVWGNLIGIGLCLAQQQWGLVKLDPETYYVSEVAIDLNIWYILLLNAGTLLICVISLMLPSLLISRITPVKAIRFD